MDARVACFSSPRAGPQCRAAAARRPRAVRLLAVFGAAMPPRVGPLLLLAACLLSGCLCTQVAPASPRVLACYWGLDRATDVTFLGFQKYVLNVLNADLCAAITDKHRDGTGAWRDSAKYLDVYEEPRSYDSFISDRALRIANDSDLWYIRDDNFLYPGGIQAMYSKARIWRLILENKLLDTYDWFLFCRTDLFWLAPVFDFRFDEAHGVFVPHAGWKNDWMGYYDRAVVVHKSRVQRVLTVMDAVSEETHPFLDALRGYPGSVGQSTNCESFYRQYLEFYSIPVKRFNFTAFVTASTSSFARIRVAQLNNDTGHTYKYTDEYIAAVNNALDYYRNLDLAPNAGSAVALPGGTGAATAARPQRKFYVVTIEEAEKINATLANCAISAWSMAVYERLLSHPLRTKHIAEAHVAFAPPHGAWDFHWPVPNGNRRNNSARADKHLPLRPGHEPYGFEIGTSCRTWYSPCGYEGCWADLNWAWGEEKLRELLDAGEVLSARGYVAVLEQLYATLQLKRGKQFMVYWDSGSPGPVAYQKQNKTNTGGYDFPFDVYKDERFIWALASSLEQFFRHGRDVSLPTPWTENVRRYAANINTQKTYFLTFKGNFGTSRPYGDVRTRAAAILHDPAHGVVVVDSTAESGKAYDYEKLMFDTVFSLILRGDQPYSYRYTEVICSGAVPVMVMSGGWVPPFSNLHPFTEYGVAVEEEDLPNLVGMLRAMKPMEVQRLRYAAKQFCMQHLITVHQQTDSLIDAALLAE